MLASEAPRDDAAARARTFAIQYGLAEMWRSFGVLPEASRRGRGALVAAVLAGTTGFEEALEAALGLGEAPAKSARRAKSRAQRPRERPGAA